MQVLFEEQEEGNTRGLGLLPGRVRSVQATSRFRTLAGTGPASSSPAPLGDAGDEQYYYFVHSYIVEPTDPGDVAAERRIRREVPSVVVHATTSGEPNFTPKRAARTVSHSFAGSSSSATPELGRT